MVIETHALTKRFGGRTAIDDVDLSVPAGIGFGFLGPNGAGKTTLIRMLMGLARPSSGTALVAGADVPRDPARALARVGAIVEEPRFHPQLTGVENLRVHAALLPDPQPALDRIPQLLQRVALDGRGGERVKGYSLGMRQRLGVARALLNDPQLLVLDEPTNGLDASGMVEFRAMIRALIEQEGRTVFLSSHLLDEVQRICDRIAIVDHGRVITEGAIGDLLAAGRRSLRIETDDPARARELIGAMPGLGPIADGGDGALLISGEGGRDLAMAVNRALVHGGVGVAALVPEEASLEERYLEITAGSTPSSPAPGAPGAPGATA